MLSICYNGAFGIWRTLKVYCIHNEDDIRGINLLLTMCVLSQKEKDQAKCIAAFLSNRPWRILALNLNREQRHVPTTTKDRTYSTSVPINLESEPWAQRILLNGLKGHHTISPWSFFRLDVLFPFHFAFTLRRSFMALFGSKFVNTGPRDSFPWRDVPTRSTFLLGFILFHQFVDQGVGADVQLPLSDGNVDLPRFPRPWICLAQIWNHGMGLGSVFVWVRRHYFDARKDLVRKLRTSKKKTFRPI